MFTSAYTAVSFKHLLGSLLCHPHRNVTGFLPPPPPSRSICPSPPFFHTHTQTVKCTQTHRAQGTNHHRLFSGPVCEWDFFFTGEDESGAAPVFVGMQLLHRGKHHHPILIFSSCWNISLTFCWLLSLLNF